MPRPKRDQTPEPDETVVTEETPVAAEAPDETPAEEVLLPFCVILDGQDRTVFAKDEADLQVRLARMRLTSPLKDGQ